MMIHEINQNDQEKILHQLFHTLKCNIFVTKSLPKIFKIIICTNSFLNILETLYLKQILQGNI